MQFSIIIPTLNEASNIEQHLAHLQPFRVNSEIIIVDGGSSDETLSLANAGADIVINSTKGRAKQMNKGASQASGDVLVFLHADTFLPNDALALIQQGMDCGNLWGRFDMVLTGSHACLVIIATLMNWRSRLSGIATGDQVIYIQRKSFIEVGGFPEIALMEDIAISKKLKQIAPPYCISQPVKSSARRWENFGLWRTILLMWWLRLGYFFGAQPATLKQLYTRGSFWKQ